jgi:hypothetical protein
MLLFRVLFITLLVQSNWNTQAQPNSLSSRSAQLKQADLQLTVEKSKFVETGFYAEIPGFCKKMAQKYPSQVSCNVMGKTAENRPIVYMVTSKKNILSPQQAQKKKVPVVFVIAGTHSGEIDGKDASLLYLKELLDNTDPKNPLNDMTVVWIPVFNVDGHEHRGRFQRPNQDGPFEQGERTTARRINLNRDWMLAQTPEMQSMLRLVNAWDPAVTIDLHVTDGLRFRHDVSLTVTPEFGGHPGITQVAKNYLDDVLQQLKKDGHRPLGFYPRLIDKEDPKQGFVLDTDSPRQSHTYAAIRNRIGVLVEDYAWESYASRVKTCRDTLDVLLNNIAKHANQIQDAQAKADKASQVSGGTNYALEFDVDIQAMDKATIKTIDLLGYSYKVLNPAPIVGGRLVSYDLLKPELWQAPFFDNVQPVDQTVVRLPQGGYVVPLAWASIVKPYLDIHGLRYQVLKNNLTALPVQAFQVLPQYINFDHASFQGRQKATIDGHWRSQTSTLQKGAIFVPIQQPKSAVVAHLLEPKGPDSLSAWGQFNTAYEISDYIANHRALELVQWMYDGNEKIREMFGDYIAEQLPAIRKEYDQKLANDEDFRLDSDARLQFWMSYLPDQDATLNLYPIMKTDRIPNF